MKKRNYIYLILIFILLQCKDKIDELEVENISFIRGKNIHLREFPDQKSKSFGFLQGGNKVKIISESNTNTKVGNLIGKWINVNVLSGKLENKTGYVFSNFILDKGVDPMDLINKDVEISKKKEYLLNLKSEFKEYAEDGLYTFNELIDFEILVAECKVRRLENPAGFEDKEALIKNFRLLKSNFNDSDLEKMTSCEFLWADGCGGTDILPYPYASYSDRESIRQIISSLIVESGDMENCYRTSDNKQYCFFVSNNEGRYLIKGICQKFTNNK
ncbi:SH3 domain-containing protein [Leptospira sp. WS60.C2]